MSYGPPVESGDLVVAVAVAKCGSFSSAAAELHLSAASVSARLAALERRLGKKLFKRGARGSSLTPAGERFVDYAERCLRILDEAVAQVGSTRSERLVVAAPASLGSLLFPLTLSVLAPYAIDVHCRVAHSDEVVRQVRDGVAHAGFVISTSPEEPMRSIRVGTSAIVAVTRPDSHLARRDRIKVVDLLTAPLIAYRWGPDADTMVSQLTFGRIHEDAPIHTVGLPECAVRLACDAGYIAVVPRFAAKEQLDSGALVELAVALGDWSLDVRFVHNPGPITRPGLETLVDGLDAMKIAV